MSKVAWEMQERPRSLSAVLTMSDCLLLICCFGGGGGDKQVEGYPAQWYGPQLSQRKEIRHMGRGVLSGIVPG